MNSHTSPVIRTIVFAKAPEGGNPCPIVFEADQLSSAQMQGLAARFGVETAFVLAANEPDCPVRLRYFVPQHEMEMCGHATVGVVSVLVKQNRLTVPPVRVETALGPISVDWRHDEKGVFVTVEQFAPTFSDATPTCAEVASALQIPETAIDFDVAPIQTVSVSRSKTIVPIQGRDVLDRLNPDFERLWSLCDQYKSTGFYLFTLDTESGDADAEARQFPRRAGYNEDPATGVAACALAVYFTEHAVLGARHEGWHEFTIEQGHSMGRPSVLQAAAKVKDGRIVRTRLGGRATIVAEENIAVAAA